ncbi:hypothetical protein NE865_07403 [Phthorimaea operculella]|nr:hypothetical protein NE865_07403 [Phthorimaea operculella]
MQAIESSRALHKYLYPHCVGQSGAWVVSTLGANVMLSALGRRKDKYFKVYEELQGNAAFKMKTGLFSKPNFDDNLLSFYGKNVTKSKVHFTTGAEAVNKWVCNQHPTFKEFNVQNSIPSDTVYVAVHVCVFESGWKKQNAESLVMKVHNTFNYTQAINYEARVLELPLRDEDFRVIILLPYEGDLLNTLFRRLTNDGLAATFASLQPLFSISDTLNPPVCTVTSQANFSLDDYKDKLKNESLVQYGSVTIDSTGVRAYVLSCLYSTESKKEVPKSEVQHTSTKENPHFFAITYCDSSVFTGQYIP